MKGWRWHLASALFIAGLAWIDGAHFGFWVVLALASQVAMALAVREATRSP